MGERQSPLSGADRLAKGVGHENGQKSRTCCRGGVTEAVQVWEQSSCSQPMQPSGSRSRADWEDVRPKVGTRGVERVGDGAEGVPNCGWSNRKSATSQNGEMRRGPLQSGCGRVRVVRRKRG